MSWPSKPTCKISCHTFDLQMASRLFKEVKLLCNYSSKFDRFLESSWILQKQCSYYNYSSNTNKQCYQQNTFIKHDRSKYGILAILTAVSIFVYSCRDKIKNWTNLFPNVQALENVETSLRQKYNFIADVVDKCASSVVCIQTTTTLRYPLEIKFSGGGSGFIVQEDGLILTNAHVIVEGQVQVKLKDGRIFPGQVEDIDRSADLATVRIQAENLPVMKLGSSDDLRAGEWVVAMGNPLTLPHSVTAGVVSSPQRDGEVLKNFGMDCSNMKFIQTDAAITRGSSGGPLVNLDGEAVGVNSIHVINGISFAIPIEYAKEFLKRSEKKKLEGGSNVQSFGEKKGYIGVSMLSITPELFNEFSQKNIQMPGFLMNGILICEVIIGSPAFKSGLQPGDVIMEINGEPVNGVQSLYKALELGIFLNMKVFRKNVVLQIAVTPEWVGTSAGLAPLVTLKHLEPCQLTGTL